MFAICVIASFVITDKEAVCQIELNADGRVGIGSSGPISTSRVYVKTSDTYGLRVNLDGVGTQAAHGIYANIQNGYADYHYGVWGMTQNSGWHGYGVVGDAHNAVSLNIGLKGSAIGGATAYGVSGYASGATTNYAGYFSGNVLATGSYLTSDQRLKREVASIPESTKQALLRLSPRTYRHATEQELETDGIKGLGLADGLHYGFIAQEIQTSIPELVRTVKHVDVREVNQEKIQTIDLLAVNYDELIPILIAVVQDQQVQIEELQVALREAGIELPNVPRRN